MGYINNTTWLEYTNVNFGSGYPQVAVRFASADTGTDIGTIQFRLGSTTATPFATVEVSGTGGWQDWQTSQAVAASPVPTGSQTVYVTFTESSVTGNFVNVNWYLFN